MDPSSDTQMLSRMDHLNRRQIQYLEEKYVTRTLKCVPDKFLEMCHMHLAFLLDLSDDKLELLMSADEQRKKKVGSVSVFKKREKAPAGLFGAPLTDEGVCLMMPLIKCLRMDKNIAKEGLFRKPGNRCRMNTLRDLLVCHGSATKIDEDCYSPYDVAGVLKEFLRELPEPLLTERHMEAHRQVLEIGKHASTPEDIAKYEKKKLSALQLLMLLMPSPVQKMMYQVVTLLQRVADCQETKMTPSTLGTIFAPIFFLNRKVDASEVCSIVSQTEPAVAFMIKHAHELFQAPKELVIDLANYWNRLEKGSPATERRPEASYQIKKSLSGRTLNTNICYIDREMSRCDDVASNTQAELESLFAHVQSLPDTPHNLKLKKQLLKATTTPTSSAKKHNRSKSISASIKKRLPSLGRSKNRHCEISSLSSSSTSSNDSKGGGVTTYKSTDKVTVVHCSQFDCCLSKPLRKRLDFHLLHQTTVTPAMSDLLKSPVTTLSNKTHVFHSRPGHKRRNTTEMDMTPGTSGCTPPKQECKGVDTMTTVASPVVMFTTQKLHPSPRITSPNENMNPSSVGSTVSRQVKSLSSTPLSRRNVPSPLTPKNNVVQAENEITYLPHQGTSKITAVVTPTVDSKPVARVQPRPCKAPGTPIMPRTLLQLAQNNAFETSI